MVSLLADIIFMPKYFDEFKYLLVTKYEILNSVLAIPIITRTAQVVVEALIHIAISIFGLPKL